MFVYHLQGINNDLNMQYIKLYFHCNCNNIVSLNKPNYMQDMLEALRVVSTFFTENNIQSRRNLRGEIERRSLLINQQFCDAFSHVIKVGRK